MPNSHFDFSGFKRPGLERLQELYNYTTSTPWKTVLGFPANSSPTKAEITKAWAKLMKLYHPDLSGMLKIPKEYLEIITKNINSAYQKAKPVPVRPLDSSDHFEKKQEEFKPSTIHNATQNLNLLFEEFLYARNKKAHAEKITKAIAQLASLLKSEKDLLAMLSLLSKHSVMFLLRLEINILPDKINSLIDSLDTLIRVSKKFQYQSIEKKIFFNYINKNKIEQLVTSADDLISLFEVAPESTYGDLLDLIDLKLLIRNKQQLFSFLKKLDFSYYASAQIFSSDIVKEFADEFKLTLKDLFELSIAIPGRSNSIFHLASSRKLIKTRYELADAWDDLYRYSKINKELAKKFALSLAKNFISNLDDLIWMLEIYPHDIKVIISEVHTSHFIENYNDLLRLINASTVNKARIKYTTTFLVDILDLDSYLKSKILNSVKNISQLNILLESLIFQPKFISSDILFDLINTAADFKMASQNFSLIRLLAITEKKISSIIKNCDDLCTLLSTRPDQARDIFRYTDHPINLIKTGNDLLNVLTPLPGEVRHWLLMQYNLAALKNLLITMNPDKAAFLFRKQPYLLTIINDKFGVSFTLDFAEKIFTPSVFPALHLTNARGAFKRMQTVIDNELTRLKDDGSSRKEILNTLKLSLNNGIRMCHLADKSEHYSYNRVIDYVTEEVNKTINSNITKLDKNHGQWLKKLGIQLLNILWLIPNIAFGIPGLLKRHYGANHTFFFSKTGKTLETAQSIQNQLKTLR